MKKHIGILLEFIGIYFIVLVAWQLLELIFSKSINPNVVDSIIGSVLAISLYYNFKGWNEGNNT